ncbi:MAG: hypothetical protein RLZ10_1635 [Bacteroidota bacterium]|jgi:hypothetical protein
MIIKIRTKDDLVELLKKGISFSWKISKWRLDHLKEVHIHDFSGKNKIKGDFNRANTQVLENGRIAIAFNNAVIEAADYSWIGQNPIKYLSNHEELALELSEHDDVDLSNEIKIKNDNSSTLVIKVFLWGFSKDDFDYLREDSEEISSIKNQIEDFFHYSDYIRSESDNAIYSLIMPSDEEIEAEGEVIYTLYSIIPLSENSNEHIQNIQEFLRDLSLKQSTLVSGYIIKKSLEIIDQLDSAEWDSYININKGNYFAYRDGDID